MRRSPVSLLALGFSLFSAAALADAPKPQAALPPAGAASPSPSALVYKDPTVGMQLHLEYPAGGGLFRGYTSRTVWLRMWGPGRVAVQSVFKRPEASRNISSHSAATEMRW